MTDSEQNTDRDVVLRQVDKLVVQCQDYLDEQEPERARALEYMNGEMRDMPADEGMSSVTSRDVRAGVRKIMPSVMRTILGNDTVVQYMPEGPEDEEACEQATDYVNSVVIPECNAEKAIYDAVMDALVVKTGILKWSAVTTRKMTCKTVTNASDDEVIGLFDVEGVEILNHEKTPDPEALEPNAMRHSFKMKRIEENKQLRLDAIPRGSFLIFPNSESIEESPIIGERQENTRSDLVSMGYDKDKVWSISANISRGDDDGDEHARNGDDWTSQARETSKANEVVVTYEVYAKIDMDNDGIAELYRIVYGRGQADDDRVRVVELEFEDVSEVPYAEVVAERDAHQFEGHSTYEELRDVQRVKTSLLRATLDNLYWINNEQPIVNMEAIENPEAVENRQFGQPIVLKKGVSAAEVLNWTETNFFAKNSYSMLEYMDRVAKDRTGITDASGGVDPEGFAQITATGANLMAEGGVAQSDMMIRTMARGGLRRAFKGLLGLVVAHRGELQVARKGKEWVEYDPSQWNPDMNCVVNVGLGAGSKERDMSMLQVVLGLQRELISSIGADNPYVTPEQLYNTLEKITEGAGFVSADPYFTKPDNEEIKQKLAAQAQQPDPEAEKVKMQMELEQAKMAAARDKEMAQMEADLQVKNAELEKESIARREELQADSIKEEQRLAFEREKLAQEYQLKVMDIQSRTGVPL